MKKLAIDIVLLPPKEITSLAIEVNKSLHPRDTEIVFENGEMLPHISLMMGAMEIEDQSSVERLLKIAAQQFTSLTLELERIEFGELPKGEIIAWFEINRTAKIKKLHEMLATHSEEALSNDDVDASMFYGQPIRKGIIEYLCNFRKECSFENFRPHITLGVGRATSELKFPISFRANTLALCHLGNYGTCRKILFSTKLGNS